MKLDPVEHPTLAVHIISRMLEISEGTVVNQNASVRLVSVDKEKQTVELELQTVYGRETIPIQKLDCDSFKMARKSEEEIRYTPEFWHAQLLTNDEVSDICQWLMKLQSAHTMAACLVEGEVEDGPIMNDFYKKQYFKALSNCCSLIQHLRALKEGVY